ncbi:Hypothetical protein, putative [Bodo saltans]|uniref:Uncharacterized protein n=1 Tax=Bodo saltans TaxID=75058 RepID=A0A0S4IWX8_BODSA|nr:Hypothetical protein, putative [Bodo saltans]|eukprot:CUG06111.1 Hypothetical protein, putative [Bodo saltans]
MASSSKVFLSPETKRRLVHDRTGGATSTTPRNSFYSQSSAVENAQYRSLKHTSHSSNSQPHISSQILSSSAQLTPGTAHRELKFGGVASPGALQSSTKNDATRDIDFFRSQAEEYKTVSIKYREVIGILSKKVEGLQRQLQGSNKPAPQGGGECEHSFSSPVATTSTTLERTLFDDKCDAPRASSSAWRQWETLSHEIMSSMSDDALALSLTKADLFDDSRNIAMRSVLSTFQTVQDECLQLAKELEHWSPNREW